MVIVTKKSSTLSSVGAGGPNSLLLQQQQLLAASSSNHHHLHHPIRSSSEAPSTSVGSTACNGRINNGGMPGANASPEACAKLLRLNVGGQRFTIRAGALLQRRAEIQSRLEHFATLGDDARKSACDLYLAETDEYYWERSPALFDAIYKFHITGQLHRPLDVCINEFSCELAYWRISDSTIAPCCGRPALSESMEELVDKEGKGLEGPPRTRREKLHRFCEGDGTLASTMFTFASISFVLISVIGLVLGSMHDLQVPILKQGARHTRINMSVAQETPDGNVIWEPHPFFGYVETLCILWFTFEYVLRITVAPARIQFLCGLMNIVDLVAIVPFYLEVVLGLCGIDVSSLGDIKGALLVIRILRVLRVVRILKLGRYSSGMRTFALTLRSSARQLGMMGMVLSTGVVFFSTLLYFVEKDEKGTKFTSIPATFWWAIVTMTTVGYGDCVPETVPGKLIASGAIISGVLVLALPITIIVDNFMKVSGNVNPNSIFAHHQPPVKADLQSDDVESVGAAATTAGLTMMTARSGD